MKDYEIVVCGGTPGGIAAALAAARLGRSVALIEYHAHLGGMSASGLGKSDIEHRQLIGGLFREFVERIRRTTSSDSARFGKRAALPRRLLLRALGGRAYVHGDDPAATHDRRLPIARAASGRRGQIGGPAKSGSATGSPTRCERSVLRCSSTRPTKAICTRWPAPRTDWGENRATSSASRTPGSCISITRRANSCRAAAERPTRDCRRIPIACA
jgi:hypothetical protein